MLQKRINLLIKANDFTHKLSIPSSRHPSEPTFNGKAHRANAGRNVHSRPTQCKLHVHSDCMMLLPNVFMHQETVRQPGELGRHEQRHTYTDSSSSDSSAPLPPSRSALTSSSPPSLLRMNGRGSGGARTPAALNCSSYQCYDATGAKLWVHRQSCGGA